MTISDRSKRILIVAKFADMIDKFNRHNILILNSLGYEVYVAANFKDYQMISKEVSKRILIWLKRHHVHAYQVDFKGGIGNISSNIHVLHQLNKIIVQNHIDVIHSHTPIGGVLGRIAGAKQNEFNIYTAHGLHFFKHGPLKNWLFFPVEWVLSWITNIEILINHEDYHLANKHFHSNQKFYIPGIGIDVEHKINVPFIHKQKIREKKRKELNISDEDFVILAVGELSKRKNHEMIIRSLKKLDNSRIKLIIAGKGILHNFLMTLAKNLNVSDQVIFLGYRDDVTELHYASDLMVFPSFQEGLGISGLEAVCDGLYILGANVRGIKDYVPNDGIGKLFDPHDYQELSILINEQIKNPQFVDLKDNKKFLEQFDSKNVDITMKKIYDKVSKGIN